MPATRPSISTRSPPALVDRIEIVTGGASAIYGSDAVTGRHQHHPKGQLRRGGGIGPEFVADGRRLWSEFSPRTRAPARTSPASAATSCSSVLYDSTKPVPGLGHQGAQQLWNSRQSRPTPVPQRRHSRPFCSGPTSSASSSTRIRSLIPFDHFLLRRAERPALRIPRSARRWSSQVHGPRE